MNVECRNKHRDNIKNFFTPHVENLCPDCKNRYEKNPLRILDCKIDKDNELMKNAPKTIDYLNDENIVELLENTTVDRIDDKLLEKLVPVLNADSKNAIFQKILDGEMDWRLINIILPYMDYMGSQVEAAVIEGVLPFEVLEMLRYIVFSSLEDKLSTWIISLCRIADTA